MKIVRRAFAPALAILVATAFLPSPAVATDAAAGSSISTPEGPDVASHRQRASAEETRRYWTPERMADAKPVPFGGVGPAQMASGPSGPQGEPGSVPPTTPSASSPLAASTTGGPAPLGITSTFVPKPYLTQPTINVGRAFFKIGKGKYSCSGTVVTAANENTIWTAGHCLRSTKGWVEKYSFCPAYDGDAATPCQYGKWTAKQLFTTPQFSKNPKISSSPYDIGAVKLAPRTATPKKIQDVVGSQGITWNQSTTQNWYVAGYPAASPYNGTDQYSCSLATAGLRNDYTGPSMPFIYCDMTGGSSGGGWMINFGGGLGFVNGVVSYGSPSQGWMASPYHGNGASKLWNKAQA